MIYLLRILHILTGAFWYGAVVFNARFLIPSVRAAGPAGGAIMAQLNQRRMSVAMMAAAIVNVATGIWLMIVVPGGATGAWMRSGMGRTIGIGAAFAILALIVGMILAPPAVRRLGMIAAAAAKRGGPAPAEEAAEVVRLQKRLDAASTIVMTLLTLALAAMAVARYVP